MDQGGGYMSAATSIVQEKAVRHILSSVAIFHAVKQTSPVIGNSTVALYR